MVKALDVAKFILGQQDESMTINEAAQAGALRAGYLLPLWIYKELDDSSLS